MASNSDNPTNTNNSKANGKDPISEAESTQPESTQPNEFQHIAPRHYFRRLEIGLLDLAHVPEDLADAVEHNATKVPFLRLPGEVRNMIWEYIFTDIEASIYVYAKTVGLFHRVAVYNSLFKNPEKRSACFLPKVCRQFYVDTSLLVYSHTTFLFPYGSPYECGTYGHKAIETWTSDLLPAHLNAITKIEKVPWTNKYFPNGWPNYRAL
ncbi:hypothetical protein K505DRAFT_341423 [Melanomma pulvis-pyrius CBS 109.77]|uniref:Uncharacterized protein n=1 Tax=Melanomma pulvis-pyrius CBS 109.77 TaxID=1314802 RepID=A0A6A6WZB5_9PLEO|nr:hypothetical protein K505DRAFT_341423 [Melanomma pulvis-pyrius CBS 109.77]